jgi:hypothetical protein
VGERSLRGSLSDLWVPGEAQVVVPREERDRHAVDPDMDRINRLDR